MALKRKAKTKTAEGGEHDNSPEAVTARTELYNQYRERLEVAAPLTRGLFEDEQKFSAKECVQRKAIILQWLAAGYTRHRACVEAGITLSSYKDWRKKDAAFDAACEEAMLAGDDALEDEAIRRAKEGVERPVFQQGECVGLVREYSDSLMAMVLPGRKSRYNRRALELSGPGGTPIKYETDITFVDGNKR